MLFLFFLAIKGVESTVYPLSPCFFRAQSFSPPLLPECVTALAVLAQTQTLQRAPSDALEPLSGAITELTEALVSLAQRCSVLVR